MTSRVPASTRLPRLDLPRSNVMRMFITTACDWTRDNQEVLHSLLDDRGLFVSGTPYTLNGKKHLITATIERFDKENTQAEIRMSYDATDYPDRVSIPRTDRREHEFLTHALKLTMGDAFFLQHRISLWRSRRFSTVVPATEPNWWNLRRIGDVSGSRCKCCQTPRRAIGRLGIWFQPIPKSNW